MLHSQPLARSAPAVGVAIVVAKSGHRAKLAERGEVGVVLDRKITGHDVRVNARVMSSCVAKSRRHSSRALTKRNARGP
jgi:hypothetical protein